MTIGQGFMIGLLIGAAVLFLLAYTLGYRRDGKRLAKVCTAKTKGTVIGYTPYIVGDCTPLPILEYKSGDKTYKVRGPEFRSYIVKVTSSPIEKNDVSASDSFNAENPPQKLSVTKRQNSLVGITPYILPQYYPKGSTWDVFYNPKKPREAFVIRACENRSTFLLLLISAICLAVFGIICGILF